MDEDSDFLVMSDDQLICGLRSLSLTSSKESGSHQWLSQTSVPDLSQSADDGYCEQAQALTLKDVNISLLQSQAVILPGCRDYSGRAVVIISCDVLRKTQTFSSCHLAQMMLYFQSTLKDTEKFLVLVDTFGHSSELWTVLDDAFFQLQAHQQDIVNDVVLLWYEVDAENTALFPASQIPYSQVQSEDELFDKWLSREQVPCLYGGSFCFDVQQWIQFRQLLEPFLSECRMSARHLLLRHAIDNHPCSLIVEKADQILAKLRSLSEKSPHNPIYREDVQRAASFYSELREAASRLSGNHSTQVVRWLSRLRSASLDRLEDISAIQRQTTDLGHRHPLPLQKEPEDRSKQETDEDTMACYQLMDKAYEWALETMRFVSRSAYADTPEAMVRQIDSLQDYALRMPEEAFFEEMLRLAKHSEPLQAQCQTVHDRCEETAELLHSRQMTLRQVLQQMEGSPRNLSFRSGQERRRRSTGGVASGSYTAFPSAYYPPVREHSPYRKVSDWTAKRQLWLSQENSLEKAKASLQVHLQLPSADNKNVSPDTEENAVEEKDSKASKTVQRILQELVQTERDYVKSLEYIIENYVCEILREDVPQALRGQRNVIFGNLEKIHDFHSHYFLAELEHAEPHTLGQCFLDFQPQFFLYALYSKNKPKSDALMGEFGNEFFKAKQLKLGEKMDLASYLLKPVQRMAKYALLLKQMLKEYSHPALQEAEEMVRFQLRHGNDLLAMDALKDCDVNVKEQGLLLRQDEFVVWQGGGRKCVRRVFLFEDLVLLSKARNDHFHYKHSIKTSEMGLTEQVGDSDTRFEIWFRKRKPADTFLLQAASPALKEEWVRDLRDILTVQAIHSKRNRLAELSSMGIGNKPCLDIQPSGNHVSDRTIRGPGQTWQPRNSVVSMSSSISSGSGTLNLGFEDSPRPLHRSPTHYSHCSTESGFCTDPGEGITIEGASDESITTAM